VKDNLDGDWEIELLSAVMEAIQRETKNEDVGKSHLSPAVCLYCSSYLQSTD
jgi:hypothetical protein